MEEERLGLLLKRISNAVKKTVDNDMKDIDITMTQGMVLGFISLHEEGTISQRDIERHFGLRHPTVSGVLKRLEQNGFVTFGTNEEDHRVKNIYITEKAYQLRSRMKVHQMQMDERMTEGFSPEELDVLRAYLKRVLANVTESQQ